MDADRPLVEVWIPREGYVWPTRSRSKPSGSYYFGAQLVRALREARDNPPPAPVTAGRLVRHDRYEPYHRLALALHALLDTDGHPDRAVREAAERAAEAAAGDPRLWDLHAAFTTLAAIDTVSAAARRTCAHALARRALCALGDHTTCAHRPPEALPPKAPRSDGAVMASRSQAR